MPFGRGLALLAKVYFGALAKRMGHLEIERYYSILIFIDKMEGKCTQHYLCEQLRIDKVSMVRMVDYLQKHKFIRKSRNEDDRREFFIELTEKSNKMLPELYLSIEDVNRAALKGISPEEIALFYKSMQTIQRNLDELPAEKIFINYKKSPVKNEG